MAGGRLKASPLAKNVAEQSGVNLQGLKGTGPDGRIIKADVIEASEKKTQKVPISQTEY